jgi:F-type H+-transporting ATPase subunit b
MATGLFLANLFLATEVPGESAGFGLNTDIFEANIVNLVIVGVLVFVFGRKFLTKTLGERRERIVTAIADAEKRQKQAETSLAEAKKQLAAAQVQAENIKKDAVTSAANAKAEIMAKAARDIETLKQTASQDTSSEQDRAIAELRQRVVALAIAKAEAQLPAALDNAKQNTLVERSIALVGS